MCGHSGLDVELDANSVLIERNGMIERSEFERNESDGERKMSESDRPGRDLGAIVSDIRCIWSVVDRKGSSGERRVRANDGKESIVDVSLHDTSDVAQLNCQLVSLERRSSLTTFNNEENWTSRLELSCRSLLVMMLVLKALRLRSGMRNTINSSTHFIKNNEDSRI